MVIAYDPATLNILVIDGNSNSLSDNLLALLAGKEFETIVSDKSISDLHKPHASHNLEMVNGEVVLVITDSGEDEDPVKTPEQLRIDQLEDELAVVQAALDSLILGGGM